MTQFFIISENGDPFEIKTVGGINLRIFGEKRLWYGELEPPLNFECEEISKISFTRFFCTPELIAFDNDIPLNISKHYVVKLKLFPVPGTF